MPQTHHGSAQTRSALRPVTADALPPFPAQTGPSPPQRAQVLISAPNTRFRRCAQVMITWRTVMG